MTEENKTSTVNVNILQGTKNSVLVLSRSKLARLARDADYPVREVNQDARALHAMLVVMDDYKKEIEALRHRYSHVDRGEVQGIHRLLQLKTYLKTPEDSDEILKGYKFGSKTVRNRNSEE